MSLYIPTAGSIGREIASDLAVFRVELFEPLDFCLREGVADTISFYEFVKRNPGEVVQWVHDNCSHYELREERHQQSWRMDNVFITFYDEQDLTMFLLRFK